jgi:hypothetical protein
MHSLWNTKDGKGTLYVLPAAWLRNEAVLPIQLLDAKAQSAKVNGKRNAKGR